MFGEIGIWPEYRLTHSSNSVLASTNGDDLSDHGRGRVQPEFAKAIGEIPDQTSFDPKFQAILSHVPYLGVPDPTQAGNNTMTMHASNVQKSAADYVDEIASLIFSRNDEPALALPQSENPISAKKAISDPQTSPTDRSPVSGARDYSSIVDGYVEKAIIEYQGLNDEIYTAKQRQFLAIEFFAKPNGPNNQ